MNESFLHDKFNFDGTNTVRKMHTNYTRNDRKFFPPFATHFQCPDVFGWPQLRWHCPGDYRTSYAIQPFYFRWAVWVEDLNKTKWWNSNANEGNSHVGLDVLNLPMSMDSITDSWMLFMFLENLLHCSVSGRTSSIHLKSGNPFLHSSYLLLSVTPPVIAPPSTK